MTLTRNFYSFGAFISGLQAVVHLVQGVVYFLLVRQIQALNLFFSWLLFCFAIVLVSSIVYTVYFRIKKYELAFWAMLIAIASTLVHLVIVLGLFYGHREWLSLYLPVEIVSLATSVVLGITLVVSEARKRRWLRISGILFITFGTLLLVPSLWYLNSPDPARLALIEQMNRWISLLGCVGPFLMMRNFLDEQKDLPSENAEWTQLSLWEKAMNVLKPFAVMATLFFILKFSSETIAKISWDKSLANKTSNWNEVWGAHTYVGARGDTLKYQLILPEDMDSASAYPMVVCLPYGGGIEGSPAAEYLLTAENRKKYPSFLFVPFCPEGSGWGGIPNYPTMDTLVFDGIGAITRNVTQIDTRRIYVTGVSRGGYGSWHFASLRPDLFAAAMPVCGGGDPALAENMVDVPVWAFHGEDDYNAPVSGSRDMIAAIKNAGGNPRYTEFEDTGHNIWTHVTRTPGAFEWLFAQHKN